MNKKPSLEIEERIHSLLCGSLENIERDEVWALIARDDSAREMFDEMLQMQTLSRTAFALDRSVAMDASMENVLWDARSLGQNQNRNARTRHDTHSQVPNQATRFGRVAGLMFRVAAVLIVAASAYIAVSAWRNTQSLCEKITSRPRQISIPELSQVEVAKFQQVWENLADQSKQTQPWAMLCNSTGKFGYVPVADNSQDSRNLLLIRCLLIDPDDKHIKTVNLLLPDKEKLNLSFQEIANLDGEPIFCDISTGRGWAKLGLAVGAEPSSATGIRGLASIGGNPSEIGSFNLKGKNIRVFVQALPLGAPSS